MDEITALQHLQHLMNAVHPLDESVSQDVASIWQPITAKRKTVLTTTGEVEKHLYFVVSGVQRAFSISENDKEATIVFTYPYSFSGIIDSFLLQTPSVYYLETLTHSQFLRADFNQVEQMMKQHHAFETMIRKSLAQLVHGLLQRQVELQCFSAEQKFITLLTRSPHVLNTIHHKYLASYLGLDATTFSKLLGSVRL